jgi:hypothetical protein
VAEWRIVSAKTATVKLFGGTREIGPALTGRRIELVFDPRQRHPDFSGQGSQIKASALSVFARHPVQPFTANVTSSRPANRSGHDRSAWRHAGSILPRRTCPGAGLPLVMINASVLSFFYLHLTRHAGRPIKSRPAVPGCGLANRSPGSDGQCWPGGR